MTNPAKSFPVPTARGRIPDPDSPPAGPVRINARALLVEGDRILLANVRGRKHFHLPGGPVAVGETVQQALRRLLHEQASIDADDVMFVGCIEAIAVDDGDTITEVDVVFAVDRAWSGEFGSRVDNLDIVSVPLAGLGELQLRPAGLRHLLPEWLTHGRPSWYGASRN